MAASQPDAARNELRLTKLALLVILLGLCVVGRRTVGWPIITWPMYSASTKGVPPPVTFDVELRIIDDTNRALKLLPVDIILKGRQEVAERAIIEAFDPETAESLREAHRRYLGGVVLRRLPEAGTVIIEGWKIEWAVDPFKLPPLDLQNPSRQVMMGRFVVSRDDPTPRDLR